MFKHAAAAAVRRQPHDKEFPSTIDASETERSLFSLFRTHVADHIAGVFDRTFWTQDLLLAARLHPIIWHGANALAAMYSCYSNGNALDARPENKQRLYSIAQAQYNAAEKHMVQAGLDANTSNSPREALLMGTVIFTCLAVLRGAQNDALAHYSSGYILLQQWGFCRGEETVPGRRVESPLPLGSLVTSLTRLNTQTISILDAGSLPRPRDTRQPWHISTAPFTAPNEVYFEFEQLLNGLLGLIQHSMVPLIMTQAQPEPDPRLPYRRAFDTWAAKFSNLQKWGDHRKVDEDAVRILRMRQKTAEIALHVNLYAGELGWDQFTPQFQTVVDLAEAHLCHVYSHPAATTNGNGSSLHQESSISPAFSFAPATIESLYFVGASCRNRDLRQRATRLLQCWPRREGLWDSSQAAAVVEAVISAEEVGPSLQSNTNCDCITGIYVCSSHRLFEIKIKPCSGGEAQVTFKTIKHLKKQYVTIA